MSNPLLEKFQTPFESAPFDLIENGHFLPALKMAIGWGKEDIAKIKAAGELATFSNTCEALENVGPFVDQIATIFFNLHSAETNEELQKIAKEFSPMLTEFANDIYLDGELFSRVKEIFEQKDKLNLSPEEMMLLTKQYKKFVRNGALLNDSEKEEIRGLDKELSGLSLEFGDHVLEETNKFELWIENSEDLSGLPESAIEAAANSAKEKGKAGQWLFTLQYPSVIPFLTYSDNRELRKKMSSAFSSRCFKGDELDNKKIVKTIVEKKHQRAQLLGYESHAHFVLEERMASTPQNVFEFLNNILDKAKPHGVEDVKKVQEFASKNGGPESIQTWDFSYYKEKLKKELYDFDDQELKPYFKLENVIQGAFNVASNLYDIRFRERKDIPVYHPDVTVYEVTSKDEKHVGIFYADFFPRAGKRSGAWMCEYRGQKMTPTGDQRPHISIVCNFSKPTETKPSLLTFSEVTTLFHEFGHALHGLLAKCKYASLSGTNVYWDFVELPSQLFENWAYEKECLDLFASHFESDEKIPEELIEKLQRSRTFQEGYMTLRQLSFAFLDMAWHSRDPKLIEDVGKYEEEAMGETRLLPKVESSNMSVSFSHIFQGGYSSGYYSYKWAEVLDADAFEAFKEEGIFNPDVAKRFKENILEKGGSEHPSVLYKRFRGKDPSPDALLRRAGILN